MLNSGCFRNFRVTGVHRYFLAMAKSLLDAFKKGLAPKKGTKDKEIEKYEKILEEHSDDRNALNTLGDLYAKRGDAEKACDYYLQVGELYAKDGFTLKAIAVYKKAQRARPKLIRTYIELADLYVQKGLIGEAKSNYLTAAEMQAAAGAKHESLDIYRKIADLDPENVNIRSKLAAMYEKEDFIEDAAIIYAEIGNVVIQEDVAEGKNYYLRAMELQPENQDILSRIGYAYVDQEMRPEATEIFEKLLELDPHNIDYREQLGELRSPPSDRHVPETPLEAAPITFSEEELTSLNFGEEPVAELQNITGLELGNPSEAEHLLEFPLTDMSSETSSTGQEPENHAVDFHIEDQGTMLSESNQADQHSSVEASSFQTDNLVDFSLAESEAQLHDEVATQESPASDRENVAQQPESAGTAGYFDLAARLDTADQLGRKYENRGPQPKGRPILKVEASESVASSEISDIIKEFKQGVLEEVGTEDYETHYELGISYKEMSLLDDAIEELKLASLEPRKFVECQGVIGLCYLEKGDYGNALRAFQEARAKVTTRSEEYQDLTYQIASSYEEAGKVDEAVQEFQRLYQLKPDYRDIKQRLNRLLR